MSDPLTVGTAGHIDHGKTALVAALTGAETDRLPEEHERGISIELGYAALELPGRRLSLVDVPGHERFVRTMVAGATGIDLFLLVVAADDGVMPQTAEHARVLRALDVDLGVAAITKSDLADPDRAAGETRALLGPDVEIVSCSVRTGAGVEAVRAALARIADRARSRAARGGPPVLHIDRAFSIRGAGTVVTGTLWSGAVATGDSVELLPAGRSARVRSVQVHDEPCERAEAGQRVALNLVGVAVADVPRGSVAFGSGAALEPTWRLDAELDLDPADAGRVQVHHGTRDTPARAHPLGERFWQLRCEQALVANAGDRVVIRRIAPPDTIGGGKVLDAHPRRHDHRRAPLEHLRALASGRPAPAAAPSAAPPEPGPAPAPAALSDRARTLAGLLLEAGIEPPADRQLGEATDAPEWAQLRAAGVVARLGPDRHIHTDALADVRRRVEAMARSGRTVTVASVRDELGTSRRYAQAILERLDADHVTVRLADDRRALRGEAR